MKNPITQILILLVKLYQKLLSPFFPGVCRYRPTCSQYMIEALKTHGVFKGLYLGTKRILKCHPWGGCGYDPVPPHKPCKRRKNEIKNKKDREDIK